MLYPLIVLAAIALALTITSSIANQRVGRLSSSVLGVSIATALAASVFFLVWPIYTDGRSLFDVSGPKLLLPLLVPVVLASLPVVTPPSVRRRACGIAGTLVTVFCVLGGFSIGLAYVPTAVLLVIAAAIPASSRQPAGRHSVPRQQTRRWT